MKKLYKKCRRKLNTNHVVPGKEVLIVDDSIGKQVNILLPWQSHHAKNVYFASGAPAILYPNHYGIYIPTENYSKEEEVKMLLI